MRYTVIFETRMTPATSATVRNRTSASPSTRSGATRREPASAPAALGGAAFLGFVVRASLSSDMVYVTVTFGTCRCVGFPTDERDTHVLGLRLAVQVGRMR